MGISYGTIKKTEEEDVLFEYRKICGDGKIFYTHNKIAFVSFGTEYSKVAIFSYGLGCVMDQFFDVCNKFSHLHKICVVIYDYPGCGLSNGSFGESYIISALEEIINITNPTILIGFSLGTGAILSYMNKVKNTKIQRILLIGAFSSIRSIGNLGPIAELTMDALINFKFKNYINITSIPKTCKMIGVYAAKDELISCKHGETLQKNNPDYELVKITEEHICHGNISLYVLSNFHLFRPDFFDHGNLLGSI